MFGAVGAFGVVFGAIGLLFAAIGTAVGVVIVRRWATARQTVGTGLVAEGVVLDTYVSVQGREHVSSTRRAIIGFRTPDGAEHRIDDPSRRMRIVGDHVVVRYLPGAPERGVVADAGSRGSGAAVLVALVFLAVFVLVGLFFAALGLGIAGLGFAGPGAG
ncbi:DUF3592 domain-containing protein [Streptacidiphilus neutrinimicus]|uniref:DUF3592 domain-containing protein n=1 Tax=Streptacidiphilus neutrinimicus TaxID=105420 RepID=UPI0005A6DFF4|nr:DUF3592 domain-containing protein [Streptacidiphilus neutrinimicus]